MHGNVLPWLLEKMHAFLNEEDLIATNSDRIVDEGFTTATNSHKDAIEKEYKRRAEVIKEQEREAAEKASQK